MAGKEVLSPEVGFEIPKVNVELYNRTREAVEQAGYNFIVPIRSVSIEDLLTEDRQREQDGKPKRLVSLSDSKTMRAIIPPEMEVAINPDRFKIVGSNGLYTDSQKKRIKQEQAALRRQLPSDIQQFVNMEMVDPSSLSQLEDAYVDITGKLLLPNYFARTDVQTVPGVVACVGRYGPAARRIVFSWLRNGGDGGMFGVSVVVLPQKLAG